MSCPLDSIPAGALVQETSVSYCTMLRGDAVAEVIKIGRPGRGNRWGYVPPSASDTRCRRAAGGVCRHNRSKKGLALSLQVRKE